MGYENKKLKCCASCCSFEGEDTYPEEPNCDNHKTCVDPIALCKDYESKSRGEKYTVSELLDRIELLERKLNA